MNADTLANPNRLMIFTNDPSEPAPTSNPPWILSTLYVMKFYSGLNPDLLDCKLYGLFFWRPEPKKQPELL
jgi:hypothetical protein